MASIASNQPRRSSLERPSYKEAEDSDSDSKGGGDWKGEVESISDEDEDLDNSEEEDLEEDSEEDEDNDKKAPAKKVWGRFRPKPREMDVNNDLSGEEAEDKAWPSQREMEQLKGLIASKKYSDLVRAIEHWR